jgi:hypothetical protein
VDNIQNFDFTGLTLDVKGGQAIIQKGN